MHVCVLKIYIYVTLFSDFSVLTVVNVKLKFDDFICTFKYIFRVLQWSNNQINCGSFSNCDVDVQTFNSEWREMNT